MNISKISRIDQVYTAPANFRDKIYDIGRTILGRIEKIPLRNKVLYLLGGASLFCIFAFVLRLRASPQATQVITDRQLISNHESFLQKLEKALRSLPKAEKGQTIYVYFLQNPYPYVWFEEDAGPFVQYREEYSKNYASTVLLGIPLDEATAEILDKTLFQGHCTSPAALWMHEFYKKNQKNGQFPGQHIALTYSEYQEVQRSGQFPSRIRQMFETNTFPPAW